MKRISIYITLLLVAVWSVGPFVWQLITSIKPDADIASLPPLLPRRATAAHYISIFTERPFLRIIANSAVVAASTTALSLATGSLAGFALAKLKIRWRALILGFILSVSMFPPVATVSPLYLIIRAVGLRDTWLALIVTYTAYTLPLSVWIMTNFFRSLPDELLKAALVDGCTPFQAFLRVMLPVAAPGLFTAAILVFIFSWNEFLFALTFTSTTASRTIPVAIALFPGIHEVPWGEIAAASVVVTMPLVLLVILFQRRIVEGLTAGAVKG